MAARKKLDAKKPLFGESAVIDGKEVIWDPAYLEAREAAIDACNKYKLDPDRDFWIKMVPVKFENKIAYQNLIIRHAACLKINEQLPPEKRFKPSCVTEGKGADGGVAFVYLCDEQGLMKTGEASSFNCKVSYLYAVAEKRLQDRVIIANAGLYEKGIYSESEADTFDKNDGEEEPAPSAGAALRNMLQSDSDERPVKAADDEAEKLAAIRSKIAATNADINKLLLHYKVQALEDMDSEQLRDCEAKLEVKEKRLSEKKPEPEPKEDFAFADRIVRNARGGCPAPAPAAAKTPEPVVLPDTGLLPDPEELEPAPKAEDAVLECQDGAPEAILKRRGKTLKEIGPNKIKALFGRADGKKYVSAPMAASIDLYLLEQKRR